MLEALYKKFIFRKPKAILAFLAVLILLLGFFASKLEIDASAETLLLENDKDLEYSRVITELYRAEDSLVLTFTPKTGDIFDPQALVLLKKLEIEIEALPLVDSVTTVLNVPLLQSPAKPVRELLKKIPTLESPDTNMTLAKKELLSSPLYSENLVSPDFKTMALSINLVYDTLYFELLKKRDDLQAKKREKSIAKDELVVLKEAQETFKEYRDKTRAENHENILAIRAIMENYKDENVALHLGGLPMIADDLVTFVKSDLKTFSYVVFGLLILMLGILFRQARWIFLPLTVCIVAVIVTSGLLGLFGWEITVVSSNFISLQLIMTMSLVIHLTVKYRELLEKSPESSQEALVLETVSSMAKPSFFVVITTITGFSSLVLSQILPIINFGWMMSIGVSISLLTTFVLFPAVVMLLEKITPKKKAVSEFSFTNLIATITYKNRKPVLLITGLFVLFSLSGATQLFVENSFINYFKQESQLYQGMAVIDQKLGGTTPLDVIINFKEAEETVSALSQEDDLDSFDDEFESDEYSEEYWFTEYKMEKVKEVHRYLETLPAVGKVLSLATMGEVGKTFNDGKYLDSFELALLYKELPQSFKKVVLSPYINIEKNQLRVMVRIKDSMEGLRRDALIKQINHDLTKIVNPQSEDFKLTGMLILYNNMLNSLFDSQIRTLGAVVFVLFLMFLVLFRSLKVALIAITVNIIPVGVIFGVMGWLSIPLDMMTITIAAISIGIAVDNTIHYIHRYKTEFAQSNDYVLSMFNSHRSIGTAMYYTAITIMIGFSVLMLSEFVPTIYFGLLTLVAMLMAILADLMLLPTLLLLFKPFKKLS